MISMFMLATIEAAEAAMGWPEAFAISVGVLAFAWVVVKLS